MKKMVEIFEILKTRFPEKNVEVRDPENFIPLQKSHFLENTKYKYKTLKSRFFGS